MDTDDVVSDSSSDSETEADEEEYNAPTGNSGEELTLQDDETSNFLVAAPDGEDFGEAGREDQDTQYEDEGEGEGADESRTVGQTPDSTDKKDLVLKKKKKKKKKFLYICLTNCKYDVVRRTARKFGFKEVSDDEDWSLYWTDFSVALERVMDMKKYQKINHFPGMNEICRKDLLARNLNRMMKMFPKEYNIFPKTWCLPADYGDFQAYTRQKKNKTYILKPESGCQGRGIWITKNPKDIKPHEHMICQVYTNKPFLIDGFKFDFRIYVLVTSCDPLRIFVFKDGLARFATNKYCDPTHSNTENVFMHLTNYAINKNSEDFVRDDEAGSKRRISTINKFLAGKGIDLEKLWTDIDDTIIKTLISAHSVLKHNYRTCFPNHVKGSACFEILGFDVLLDRRLRPFVIEVNHSPSFGTDAQLDREIKGTLIWDTLGLINFGAVDRKRCLEEERRRIKDRLLGKNTKKETKEELEQAQQQYLEQLERYENCHLGNFRRIFPSPGCDKYDKFFHSSGTLFQETAAFRARSELARQQREEIMRKKEKMEQMLKKGKRGEGGVRPESPTGRRKRPSWHRNPSMSFKPRFSQHTHEDKSYHDDSVDTRVPMDILEEDELERISGLLQRDNLVRGLGIVEHVYRLLHCTPGTVGVVKPDVKPQPLSLALPPPYQIRPKDRCYYRKLLDRYFGPNHALSKDSAHDSTPTPSASTPAGRGPPTRSSDPTAVNRTWNATVSGGQRWVGRYGAGGGDGDRGGGGGGGGAGGKAASGLGMLQPSPKGRLAFGSYCYNNNNNSYFSCQQRASSSSQTSQSSQGGGGGGSDLDSDLGSEITDSNFNHHHHQPPAAGATLAAAKATAAQFTGTDSQDPRSSANHHNPNSANKHNPNTANHHYQQHSNTSATGLFHSAATHHQSNPASHSVPLPLTHSCPAHADAAAAAQSSSFAASSASLAALNQLLLSEFTSAEAGSGSSSSKPEEEKGGGGGGMRRSSSCRVVSGTQRPSSSSATRYMASPVISPFSAPHPSSAGKLGSGAAGGSHHGRSGLPSRPSRFTVQAPLSSGLLRGSPLLSLILPPQTPPTSFRIPASSSSLQAFPPPPSSSSPAPQSQSVSVCASQPGVPGSQRWPMKSKSLGNLNERTLPAYQRNKLARKPLGGAGGGGVGLGVGVGGRGGVVVQESDLRSMTGLMDTEAERHRLLARTGYNYPPPSYAQAPPPGHPGHQHGGGGYGHGPQHQGYTSSGYQSDWRSDNSTPARTRVLSAHRQPRDTTGLGVTRFIAQHPSHGLSVVSAPAPVLQRPDVASPGYSALPRHTPPVQVTGSGLEVVTAASRSTRTQRIRGATNTVRLRQMEMRENHAFVFS